MAKTVTSGGILKIQDNPIPESSLEVWDLVLQVLDLKAAGNRYMFTASDGTMKLKAILPSNLTSEVISGKIQNLGLIRILDYSLNDIPNKLEKYLIVTKCEVVSPALEMEIKNVVESEESEIFLTPRQENDCESEVKAEKPGILLKSKPEIIAKSAAQIVNEQRSNLAPAARMAMTRRVHPLLSLNPYQGNWTIKVRVTNKEAMRNYKNTRGEGCVFNVELTDDDETQIQATMFNEAARKFYDKFELGKVYYISKGTLKVANKKFSTVKNDYEMTLNENSEVEEVINEATFVPVTKFNFVPIDMLGPYVNGKELVDVIGVVQIVSSAISIRRKINNETSPKREIIIADETKKTVVVALWNELATNVGQELLDMVDQSPVIAIKSLRVGDFQGVSLSSVCRSKVLVNPDIPEAKKLKLWFDSEGRGTSMASVGSSLSPSSKNGGRSMYSDRISLSYIIQNPSIGDDKTMFFSIRAYISYIKPDQTMWYRACKTCNKKATDALGSGFWCEGCQKSNAECSLRYIMVVRISDPSGEVYLSLFNDEAEKIIGCTADELDRMKSEIGEENKYEMKLKEATWVPYLFRVSVSQNQYNNEKRQRITARAVAPVDFASESKLLLEQISSLFGFVFQAFLYLARAGI